MTTPSPRPVSTMSFLGQVRVMRSRILGGSAIGLAIAASSFAGAPFVAYAQDAACGPRDDRACQRRPADSTIDREKIGPNIEIGGVRRVTSGEGFRISVDGVADGEDAGEVDAQRRADVALAGADVVLQIDPMKPAPVLNIAPDRKTVGAGQAVGFRTFSNYPTFVERAEVRIFRPDAATTQTPIATLPVALGGAVEWSAPADMEGARYVLRVYDRRGRFDETEPGDLSIVSDVSDYPVPPEDILAENRRTMANIPVSGARVTVRVVGAAQGERVSIMGYPALVDDAGVAFAQVILPPGHHDVRVTLTGADGATRSIVRPADVPDNDEFYVVQAEITAGTQKISGDPTLSAAPDSDPDKNYVDGRLAFYYSGLLGRDWRLVASADTQEGRLEDLFTNFTKKDTRSLLRRIDPETSWPVFGDDSTLEDDAPTSGKFYVRVENGDSRVMWGDFQTSLTGTDLANYSRSLYGAQLQYRTQEHTSFGDPVVRIDAFGADPGTAPARDEFRGTGGSVYFLRRQDVTQGSERVFIEVRDRDSGLVKSRQELQPARDFDINYLQGRIFLREPLNSTASGASFVRDASMAGDPAYLVVAYEYAPGLTAPEAWVYGGRTQAWIAEMVQVGATGYHDGADGAEQTVVASDVTVRFAPGAYVRGEIARSDGSGVGEMLSGTGGYDFTLLRPLPRKATAKRIEGALDLSEITDRMTGRMSAYWQDREAGFSAPGQITANGAETQFGAAVDVTFASKIRFNLEADSRDNDYEKRVVVEGGVEAPLFDGYYVSLGARHDDRQDNGGASLLPNLSPTLNETGARTDGVVTLGLRPKDAEVGATPAWDVYVFGQATLDRDATRRRNDRYGLGGQFRAWEGTNLEAEVSDGDLGLGARIGMNQQVDDDTSIYLSYLLAAENPDACDPGRQGQITGGVKRRYSDAVNAFGEGRYAHGAGPTGFTQNYGINFTPSERWSFALGYETGTLSEPTSGDIERNAVSGTVNYGHDDARGSLTLEYRDDDSAQSGSREAFVWRALVGADLDEDWRAFVKFNGAKTNDASDATLEADFIEATLGAAYRPVSNDRWNALLKYTYLEDLPSPAQVSAGGLSIDYAQRGHIAAADITYDVTQWLTVGGKVAWKKAELRLSRDGSAPWFSQTSTFGALRLDAEFIKDWSAVAEYRVLDVSDIDARSGGVAAVYYTVNTNLRVGAGYNFTDFSDDLSETSYDARGAFFNLIAAY